MSAACIALAFLYFSNPGSVVVTPKGKLTGLINSLRASVQGKRFWRHQLERAESRLAFFESQPGSDAEYREQTAQYDEETKRIIESAFAKRNLPSPELEPPSEADLLRMRADELDAAPVRALLTDLRQQNISELSKIIPIIKTRMK